MKRFSKGWGFKIDYAKAIKEDEALIADCTRAIENHWFIPVWHPPLATIRVEAPNVEKGESEYCEYWTLIQLFLTFPEYAYAAGLTDEDLGVLVHTLDGYEGPLYDRFPVPISGPQLWKKSDELISKIEQLLPSGTLYSEESNRATLKRAKASLARHKRNAKLYGP